MIIIISVQSFNSTHSTEQTKLIFLKTGSIPELNRQYNKKFSTYSFSICLYIYYATYRLQTEHEREVGMKERIQWVEKMNSIIKI